MMHYILNKIIARRTEKKYSQEYMAKCLKITQGNYNKIENGKIEITAKTLFEIMEILDMQPSDIFGSHSRLQRNRPLNT